MKFLAENERYKVYSIYESVYLKDKSISENLIDYSDDDIFITAIYGDPSNAILIGNKKSQHILISGCGINIFDINTGKCLELFTQKNNMLWTFAIHQEDSDCQLTEFRFISYDNTDIPVIYKMNLKDKAPTKLT